MSRRSGVVAGGLSIAALSALLAATTLPKLPATAADDAGVTEPQSQPSKDTGYVIDGDSYSVSVPLPASARETGLRKSNQTSTDNRKGSAFDIGSKVQLEIFVVPGNGPSALAEIEKAGKELSSRPSSYSNFTAQRVSVNGASGCLISYQLDNPSTVFRRTAVYDFAAGGQNYSLTIRANFSQTGQLAPADLQALEATFKSAESAFMSPKISIK